MSRSEYAFESRKVTPEEVRGLLYREILEYHPQAKREFEGSENASSFGYATSAVGADFAAAEEAAAEAASQGSTPRRELRRRRGRPSRGSKRAIIVPSEGNFLRNYRVIRPAYHKF